MSTSFPKAQLFHKHIFLIKKELVFTDFVVLNMSLGFLIVL